MTAFMYITCFIDELGLRGGQLYTAPLIQFGKIQRFFHSRIM